MRTQIDHCKSSVLVSAGLAFFMTHLFAQEGVREEIRADEMPRLEVSSIDATPEQPAPGERTAVAVEVANGGDVPVQSVSLTLRVDNAVAARRIIDLAPHSSQQVDFFWTPDRFGNHVLEAVLDEEARFPEIERADNLLALTIVVAQRAPREADFAVTNLEIVERDERRVIHATVKNNGTVAGSTPLTLLIGGQLLRSELIDILRPRETRTIEFAVPSDIVLERFQVELNPRNRFAERNASNNLFISDLRPDVDIAVEDLRILSNRQGQSSEVTVAFRIRNRGKADVTKPFRTRIDPPLPDADGIARSMYIAHSELKAGDVIYVSHILYGGPNTLDIAVIVDPDQAIIESNETNNTARKQVRRSAPEIGRWVSIGPRRLDGLSEFHKWDKSSGRLSMLVIDPRSPTTLYVGSDYGGVWKSTDGGAKWFSIWSNLPTQRIASIALDPTDSSQVYVATQDKGVFLSQDAGRTWTQILTDQKQVNLDPYWSSLYYNSGRDSLYINDRYGGKIHRARRVGGNWQPWQMVLSMGDFVRAFVQDPTKPDRLYAAVQHKTNNNQAGIYFSFDGGDNWRRSGGCPGSMLPTDTSGKDITVALSQGRLYAGFFWASENPTRRHVQIYRTTDISCNIGGVSERAWELGWDHHTSTGESHYGKLWAHPGNRNLLFMQGVDLWRSIDGGTEFYRQGSYDDPGSAHADHHASGGHSSQPTLVYALGDGGIYRSLQSGAKGSWSYLGDGLRNVEFYDHIAAPTKPYLVIGGTQDNGTLRWDGGTGVWRAILGGDGFTVAIDVTKENVFYAMHQYADELQRSEDGGGGWSPAAGSGANRLPHIGTNTLHFHVHPHPNKYGTLLATPQDGPLYHTVDHGSNWKKIFNPGQGKIVRSAIDGSVDLYYAGSDDGHLYAGLHGNKFQDVFAPTGRRVIDIRVDPNRPARVYVAFEGTSRVFQLERTSIDPPSVRGIDITGDLEPNLRVQTLTVDVLRSDTVYVGTKRGVYRGRMQTDGNWKWDDYSYGMPRGADVRDLEVHRKTGILRAATYGRSAYEVKTDFLIGSVIAARGKVSMLRVHDVGSGYGPATDFLDTEVVIKIDSDPQKAFGVQLRGDSQLAAHRRMLDLLRDAFNRNRPVQIDYIRTGLLTGRIFRVLDLF